MPRSSEPLSKEGKKTKAEVTKVTGYSPYAIEDLPPPPKDKQFTINGFIPVEEK